MSRLLRLKYPCAFSFGLLFSILGAILILIGFFFPMVFNHSMAGMGNGQTQWDMVTNGYAWILANEQRYSSSTDGLFKLMCILTPVLTVLAVYPFLNALISLVMSSTAILRQQHPAQARWKRPIIGTGAILEILICLSTFAYYWVWGAFIGPGFILPLLGSLFLLVGEVRQGKSTKTNDYSRAEER